MMAFFVVALRMSQAKVQEIIAATQAAWVDMLNGGSKAGMSIETQAPATDQAFTNPEAISIRKSCVCGGNLIFLVRRHDGLSTRLLCSGDRWSGGCGSPGSLRDTPGRDRWRYIPGPAPIAP